MNRAGLGLPRWAGEGLCGAGLCVGTSSSAGDGKHAWRRVEEALPGGWGGPSWDRVAGCVPGLIDCHRPQVIGCEYCGCRMQMPCGATTDDKCLPCARLHRFDVSRLVRSGFSADRPEGFFFITLTAPGADVLPFDLRRCELPPGHVCSGDLGCKVSVDDCATLNASMPRRWWEFMRDLRRALGVDVQYVGVWEDQKRGLLHRHAIVWAAGVSERRFRAAFVMCALRLGFGRNVRRKGACQAISGRAAATISQASSGGDPVWGDGTAPGFVVAARYIAKYVTKGGAKVWTRNGAGELVEAHPRRWSASRRWGVTMRGIREARRAYWGDARGRSGCAVPDGAPDATGVAGGAAALVINTDISPDSVIDSLCGVFPFSVLV